MGRPVAARADADGGPPGQADFIGAKLGLLGPGGILAYLRDDHADLRWAGLWDLPGGGREGREAPQDCVLRELSEEFGLTLPPSRLEHGWPMPSISSPGRVGWMYLGRISAEEVAAIRFGDEGQYWKMMAVEDFLLHPQGIPPLQDWLSEALSRAGWGRRS